MSKFKSDEQELVTEEMGWRRPGTIGVPSHVREGGDVLVEAHERRYPDVWEDRAEYKASLGAVPLQLTRLKTFKKGNKICATGIVEAANGAKLCVGICLPLDAPEIGFGIPDWGDIKDAASTAWDGVKEAGKYAGKGLVKVVKSPEFQELVLQAAPAAGAAFGIPPQYTQVATNYARQQGLGVGVPPKLTDAATQVVDQAGAGDPNALAKIQNIVQQALKGYPPAQKLQQVMSAYYDRITELQQKMAQMEQVVQSYQQQLYNSAYASGNGGMRRFQASTPGWGRGRISGWVYNVPYRGISAVLDSPAMKLRALYRSGMQVSGEHGFRNYQIGARRPGTFGVPSHVREGGDVLVEAHERRYPDVWNYKGEWNE